MSKMRERLIERRKYIRLPVPVQITYSIPETNKFYSTITKNISADGLRFETQDRDLAVGDVVELKLNIPGALCPVHAKSRVIWKKRLSLEDCTPFDVGLEFFEIEDDNKNTFLKFLCDLIYNLPKETIDEKKKS